MSEELWMVEAIIQPFKLEPVAIALASLPGFAGVTVTDCRGFGQGSLPSERKVLATGPGEPASEQPAALDLDDFRPNVKLEIVVSGRAHADAVINTIARVAHTGRKGDGRIFVWPVIRAVRVRTFPDDTGAR